MVSKKRIEIGGQWFRVSEKTGRASKIPLTRCSNTMTEAEFRSWVLGGLRDRTMMWKPAQEAWKLHTRENQSESRHKIEHQCQHCMEWFVKKKIKIGKVSRNTIELDHIVPIGGLDSLDKAGAWINKAYVEVDGYQKLCYQCHQVKTNLEKKRT